MTMKVTALAGGVGAAKFLQGLALVIPPENITIISNTGDDIELYGLRICPDIDTVIYTLAGYSDEVKGWGLKNDSFECLSWLSRYGESPWFNLGDRDLATHIYRTELLRTGCSLSEATDRIRESLGVRSRVLPMTDYYTPTWITTDEGEMHFQEYFVRRKCEPRVAAIRFANIESARPAAGVEAAILNADLIVICPSNPFISIGPIMAVPGVTDALKQTSGAKIAISPIVGGKALKGPAAGMLRDLGHEVSAWGVARIYRDFLNLFVLDNRDEADKARVEALGVRVVTTDTVMNTLDDKRRLADFVMNLVTEWNGARLQRA